MTAKRTKRLKQRLEAKGLGKETTEDIIECCKFYIDKRKVNNAKRNNRTKEIPAKCQSDC